MLAQRDWAQATKSLTLQLHSLALESRSSNSKTTASSITFLHANKRLGRTSDRGHVWLDASDAETRRPGVFSSAPRSQTSKVKSNDVPLRLMASAEQHAESVAAPLVVVGSANADVYIEVERIPAPGETVGGETGAVLPGGKGANQAACAAKLGYPTYFVGQVGRDENGKLLSGALSACGVRLEHLGEVAGPTGHALVMLQPGGQNSIIIVGGANMAWPPSPLTNARLTPQARAAIQAGAALLLQREVPDSLNLEAAQVAHSAGVPVILDAGGADGPLSDHLLTLVTTFSPNETELARVTGMPTASLEEVEAAARWCLQRGPGEVVVKLGELGSLLVAADGEVVSQPCVGASSVVDTTGAGDTFTAAYAVGLAEKMSRREALRFAAAAASITVSQKGAIPSMPDRAAVDKIQELLVQATVLP